MKIKRGMGIHYRMLLIYLLGGMVPMTFVCVFLLSSTSQVLLEQTKSSQMSELEMMRDVLSESVNIMTDVTKHFYFDDELEYISSNWYEDYTDQINDFQNYNKFGEYRGYYINLIEWMCMYMENETISSNSRFVRVTEDIQKEEWYRQVLEANGQCVWHYGAMPSGMGRYLRLSRAVRDKGRNLVGVLSIYYRNERFHELLDERAAQTYIVLDGDQIIAGNGDWDGQEGTAAFIPEQLRDNPAASLYQVFDKDGSPHVLTAVCLDIPESGSTLHIVSIQKESEILKEVNAQKRSSWLIVLFSVLVSVSLIALYSRSFGRRVTIFLQQMQKASAGEFEIQQNIGGHDEITELYGYLNTMICSIQALVAEVYQEQVQKEQLYSRQRDMEFKMLASQINPHFLYNTLETIRMKARARKEYEIEELTKMLAEILRSNLQAGNHLIPLETELRLLQYYLKIQQHRFGERIQYEILQNLPIGQLQVLPLLIQPIVENAVVHGLEMKEGQGRIRIIIDKNEEALYITVEDNGIGMTREQLLRINEEMEDFENLDRTHIGVSNVHQRIQLFYGSGFGLTMMSVHLEGTRVIIRLPLKTVRMDGVS